MAPIKKRLSDLDLISPSSTKRPKLFLPVHADMELLRMRETLLLQSVALERAVQSASIIFNRQEMLRQPSNGLSYRPAIVAPSFEVVPNIIYPESAIAGETFSDINSDSSRHPRFQGRRDSSSDVSIGRNNPPGINSTTSPLDLLSSVSSYVASSSSIPSPKTMSSQKDRGHHHRTAEIHHGKGIMRYSNGCHYVGFFLNEKRHGYGKCWYPNGCVYAGQWEEGKRQGSGKMSYANGDTYDGTWKEDKRHGAGVYYWKDGRADVCRFYEEDIVGEGCRWSADRKIAWRLIDGEMAEKRNLTLEGGRMIAKSLGVVSP
ncbi:hypothetical protein HJC23_007872 [Cyclotella cryptica]|uniref:MORN repeat-containing protein n=1 Tax=Cyclotella cryptica TaxID=29204 RepID=A0ABD3R3W6_9STRA|eukprot:CCRYP_000200-RA/>CCRYP_000200-RA protein AED:0.00 eAED:0.00 QI:126/-1/1/1/-1/1/1/158/316